MSLLETTSLLVAVVLIAGCDGFHRQLKLKRNWNSGPRWTGEIHCPLDFGIVVENLEIFVPCESNSIENINCSHIDNYQPDKLLELRASCVLKNSCPVRLFEKTIFDGTDVIISYDCESLLAPHLFASKMVKRFYHEENGADSEYCAVPSSRVRAIRGGDGNHYIGRVPPVQYTFEGLVLARILLATARFRGYFLWERPQGSDTVYQTRVMRTVSLPSGGTVDVPVYISANITQFDLQRSDTRRPFDRQVTDYLDQCGIRRDSNPDDGGHLVAYTIGGTDDTFNLVPMARDLNRRQGIWYRHEEEVRRYLASNPYGMVRWEVVVIYPVHATQRLRPAAFALRYTLYNNIHDLTNGEERIEVFINENEEYRNDQCTLDLADFFNPSNPQDPSFD